LVSGAGGHHYYSQPVLHLQNFSFSIYQGKILLLKLAEISLVIMTWYEMVELALELALTPKIMFS
jgi:hypothetical protein